MRLSLAANRAPRRRARRSGPLQARCSLPHGPDGCPGTGAVMGILASGRRGPGGMVSPYAFCGAGRAGRLGDAGWLQQGCSRGSVDSRRSPTREAASAWPPLIPPRWRVASTRTPRSQDAPTFSLGTDAPGELPASPPLGATPMQNHYGRSVGPRPSRCPLPTRPTTSSSRKTISPRRRVITGQPVTLQPS